MTGHDETPNPFRALAATARLLPWPVRHRVLTRYGRPHRPQHPSMLDLIKEKRMRWPWTRRERPEANHTNPIPDYDRVFPPEQQRGRPIWSPLLGRWIDAPDPKSLTEPTEQYPIVTPAQRQRGRGAEAGR